MIKYNTIKKLQNNEITQKEAMGELNKSRQQIYRLSKKYLQEGETAEAFCRGTGTYNGHTFQECLDNNNFRYTGEMVEKNYINVVDIIERPSYCDTTDIIIPKKINGKSVTTIGYEAFFENQLTGVIIPNSVSTIGYEAFGNNQKTIEYEKLFAVGSRLTGGCLYGEAPGGFAGRVKIRYGS